MTAYYNEHDPFAAAWLRELIKAGHIAPGEVDERSIEDVVPTDLRGFNQCHFFAGIGVWSYALRRAGWPDDRPVWTGSCPCQPFSTAGKRTGTADERHLWPSLFHLIQQAAPVTFFGEQVGSKDGLAWLDTVSSDLEGTGYTFGAVDTCAAGFGAPHIRQRLYFVAYSNWSISSEEREQRGRKLVQVSQDEMAGVGLADTPQQCLYRSRNSGETRGSKPTNGSELGDSPSSLLGRERPEQNRVAGAEAIQQGNWQADADDFTRPVSAGVAQGDTLNTGLQGHRGLKQERSTEGWQSSQRHGTEAGLVNGFWRETDWIACRDGKYRPVEPGTFPLAHGATARVGRLRGYGNAIVAPVATAVIEAFLETERGSQ